VRSPRWLRGWTKANGGHLLAILGVLAQVVGANKAACAAGDANFAKGNPMDGGVRR